MDNIDKIIKETQKGYDREYKTKRLNIVTTVMDATSESCDKQDKEQNKMTVMKYYTVKPKEYFTRRQYERCDGRVLKTYTRMIPPRRFYTETEVYEYARYINRVAGRTLETDEMNLLLKTIARGRQYELVCVEDITEQVKEHTVWRDIR